MKNSNTRGRIAAVTLVASVLLFGALLPASAQHRTLRNPLIECAPNEQPYVAPQEGDPPPPGDGSSPAPVTRGDGGSPELLPWVPFIPANQIDQSNSHVSLPDPSTLSSPGELGPSLQVPHPPSTPGADPQSIHAPLDFRPPPVAVVKINPGGGMPGDQAPQERWGGQFSRDFGLRRGGSSLTDFGEKLTEKPDIKVQPQHSEDGPRQSAQGQIGFSPNRSPNLPRAQGTQDIGHRIYFKGANLRSRLTIAPY